jgi:hypothetical protein
MDSISRVVIGMDPHKRSATIETMGRDDQVLGVAVSVPIPPGSKR